MAADIQSALRDALQRVRCSCGRHIFHNDKAMLRHLRQVASRTPHAAPKKYRPVTRKHAEMHGASIRILIHTTCAPMQKNTVAAAEQCWNQLTSDREDSNEDFFRK